MTTLSDADVILKCKALKQRYLARDARYSDVAAVRRGDYNQVFAGMFTDDLPKEVVANFVDTAARDLSEVIAPLPSLNCTASNTVSDPARKRADKRTKIVANYIEHSDLETQMFDGSDHYLTYSFLPFYVEADHDAKTPRITLESPVGGYPEFDRWNRVVRYARYIEKTVGELCADFPEHAGVIRGTNGKQRGDDHRMELVRYCDDIRVVLLLPSTRGMDSDLVLASYNHNLGECPMKVAQRPQWDTEMRGQWDSVIWVQVARARMALYAMEAAEKSVQAPLMMPPDVQDMPFGGDAVIYTNSPEKARRLPLELPQAAFAELKNLGDEMRLGARYPEGRTGNLSASVVTGRGVQELLAGFDTQVKTAQTIFKRVLADVVKLCFKMDETYWPKEDKTIRGTADDAKYEIHYVPSRDIGGDHTVEVTYGFAAGMDPNRAAVMLLQLRGDRAISRQFMLSQMPFSINVTDELAQIDVEEMRGAALQGLMGLSAAIPQLVAQGQDVTKMVAAIALAVEYRQQGMMPEIAIQKALAPPEPPPAPDGATPSGVPGEPQAPGAGSAGGALSPGVAPGQAGMGPGGSADLQMMLSRLTSGGGADSSVGTSRRIPA